MAVCSMTIERALDDRRLRARCWPISATWALRLGLSTALLLGACSSAPQDIIAQLPTTIGGRSFSYQVEQGIGAFGDPRGITDILTAAGRSPDDLTTARGEAFDPHLWVMALRAPGVDPAKFVDLLAGGFDRWTETVGGKNVIRAAPAGMDRSLASYLYIVGDTLVYIEAPESPNQASEVLAKLP
jgi:hypothetical protein